MVYYAIKSIVSNFEYTEENDDRHIAREPCSGNSR